ncbi:hypothetical protein GCM10023079_20610 [Streptomyces chitinivorans]
MERPPGQRLQLAAQLRAPQPEHEAEPGPYVGVAGIGIWKIANAHDVPEAVSMSDKRKRPCKPSAIPGGRAKGFPRGGRDGAPHELARYTVRIRRSARHPVAVAGDRHGLALRPVAPPAGGPSDR